MTIPAHPVFGAMPDAFLDALGDECIVTIGGVSKTVRGILRAPHEQIVPDAGYGEPGVNGARPRASFAEADVPGLKNGDRVTHAGVTWKICEPLPDGRGMVRCELERS